MEGINVKKISEFFKTLGHPVRLTIVLKLLDGKKCVSNLEELIKARQPNISQHLRLLKLNEIVDWKQEGKMRCYFLKNPQVVKEILKLFKRR
ncbi:MAG: ArsR family transcriptional regulator [Caldiserica bacterium]|nr:MAG: ArsR family transcriptional regulator [Caldisericota bacterium]